MRPKWIVPLLMVLLMVAGLSHAAPAPQSAPTFSLPDTAQVTCYDENGAGITCPGPDGALYGQDATYQRAAPAYQVNGDGTVTDLVTGLMWQKTPGEKLTFEAALANAESFTLAGYDDWRLPTIKELYSLIIFTGVSSGETGTIPYIDTTAFDFEYGDTSAGERTIDAQYWSSTRYVSTTMNNMPTAFGVNFADGRIKGYPTNKANFVLHVRGGNGAYGVNALVDNGDGTLTDNATGLTWLQGDSGSFGAGENGDGLINWSAALAWCEGLSYAGADDWRLPDAKELQAIVDYTRSPDTTASAAIDPLFIATPITDEGGGTNFGFYWTGTTHLDGPRAGDAAVYVAFGEALGFMQMPPDSGNYTLLDVHGAGAQRSDPKAGDPADHPIGQGPQGDVRRIFNLARCVRGGEYVALVGLAPVESTNSGQGQPPQGGSAPQVAINACNGLSEGAACSFVAPQGSVTGTCGQTPDGVLACMPAGGPPPQGN